MWTSTVRPFFPHQLSHWAVLLYDNIYIIIPLVSEIIENGSPDQEKKRISTSIIFNSWNGYLLICWPEKCNNPTPQEGRGKERMKHCGTFYFTWTRNRLTFFLNQNTTQWPPQEEKKTINIMVSCVPIQTTGPVSGTPQSVCPWMK